VTSLQQNRNYFSVFPKVVLRLRVQESCCQPGLFGHFSDWDQHLGRFGDAEVALSAPSFCWHSEPSWM